MMILFYCFLILLLLDQADIIRIKCLHKFSDKCQNLSNRIDNIFISKPISHIPPIPIRILETNSILYAYRLDNNHYVTQAINPIELLQNLYLILDTSYISITEEDGASFIKDYIIK